MQEGWPYLMKGFGWGLWQDYGEMRKFAVIEKEFGCVVAVVGIDREDFH